MSECYPSAFPSASPSIHPSPLLHLSEDITIHDSCLAVAFGKMLWATLPRRRVAYIPYPIYFFLPVSYVTTVECLAVIAYHLQKVHD